MNILSRACRALLVALVLSALGAHAACGINTQGSPEPDLYVGYFPRGVCRIQFFTNAPPEATASIWPRPGIAINSLGVTAPAIFQTNRRVTADFGEYGSYRGRMRKDGCVIVGRLRARNFPDSKNVNRVLRLQPLYPVSYGYGAVLEILPLRPQPPNGIDESPILPPIRRP